jgi:hypothetical protein
MNSYIVWDASSVTNVGDKRCGILFVIAQGSVRGVGRFQRYKCGG